MCFAVAAPVAVRDLQPVLPESNFRPHQRLHKPWEYKRFFSDESHWIPLRHCQVYRIDNSLGHARLGISVRAKGKAVDRNRIKRQIREFFRRECKGLGSFDYHVVIPRKKSIRQGLSSPERRRARGFSKLVVKSLREELPNALGAHRAS